MPANIDISHPDKLLFPEGGITKRDVADYYRKIADYMLPYLKERPLTLVWKKRRKHRTENKKKK